jgi:phytoene desaturase
MTKVAVIGAGFGGISAAIHLARKGYEVAVFEKQQQPGGKAGQVEMDGYRFDTGPTLMTMPFVLEDLLSDGQMPQMTALDPITSYFFPDQKRLDTYAERDKVMAQLAPQAAAEYSRFLDYARTIYDTSKDVFLFTPLHEASEMVRFKNFVLLMQILKIDPLRSMQAAIEKRISDPYLRQIFSRFATYNGSNPYIAPATLNIIAWVELGIGGFYIKGGMHSLVQTLVAHAEKLGVTFHFAQNIDRILTTNQQISGIRIGSDKLNFDHVVCNADALYAYEELLPEAGLTQKSRHADASLSGMVFLWGVNKTHDQLNHHNIFFSRNYKQEFSDLFKTRVAPADPTVYISIASKSDSDMAPAQSENWFVMVNMPPLQKQQTISENQIAAIRSAVIETISRQGINISQNIETEKILTPMYLKNTLNSYNGSIYGLSSNSRRSAFNRIPNRSKQIRGLYFAGGSSHPGGGVPLAILSGKMAAKLLHKNNKSILRRTA